MKRVILVLLVAVSAGAQERVDLLIDIEGVHRTAGVDPVVGASGVIYRPDFDNGGGIGGGVNWHFSSRVSLELKVAVLWTGAEVRVVGPDFIGVIELEDSRVFPITAVVQWHPFEEGSFRPYFGGGVSHVILTNIGETTLTPEIEFDDPTGLVLNGGVRLIMSKRWSLYGDAKYIPLETSGNVRFDDDEAPVEAEINVRPLVVAFGLAYHF
jgi:outer membrane protein W